MPTDKSPATCSLFTDEEWTTLSCELKLSPQQSRVVQLLTAGLCDKQIASRLNIKLPTVRMHLSRIFTKLGVSDRTELVVHVFKHFRSITTSNSIAAEPTTPESTAFTS